VGAFNRLISLSLPLVPRFVVGRVARPYIAGEALSDAIRTIRELAARGALGTLDLLGEEIRDIPASLEIGRRYEAILDAIAQQDVSSGVSVKLTALGLRLDPEITRGMLRNIVTRAREIGRFVRIDMEDATTTDETLAIHRELREDGFDNVGVVLQACLKRTEADAEELAAAGADVRVVKGIYIEPEEIAWRDRAKINDQFMRVTRILIDGGATTVVATHDDELIRQTVDLMVERGLEPGELEFQMLLGVREERRDELLAAGHRMRIYIPFGEQWYAYCVRRLRENPEIAGHVTKALFGRIFGRKAKSEVTANGGEEISGE
jgi:proline dehydrogenase